MELRVSNPHQCLVQLHQSSSFRAGIITLLAALFLIPLFLIGKVITARHDHQQNVLQTVAGHWGQRQTLTGPVLVVPYVEHINSVDTVTDKDGESRVVSKDVYNDHTAILLPEVLEIRADLKEEHQQQGIYDALVYTANISLSGKFDHNVLMKSGEGERRIQWDKAYVMLGMSDTRAITGGAPSLLWGEDRVALEPGTMMPNVLPLGLHATLPAGDYAGDTGHTFKMTLNLRGSDGFFFTPLGKDTKARISSSWTQPIFQGNALPVTHETNGQGFNAEWEIPHLMRNYPQYWELGDKANHDLNSFTAGVSLQQTGTAYTQAQKLLPHTAFILGWIFLVLLVIERERQQRLPLMQYVLVGTVFALFHLVLLALAEYLPFDYAYPLTTGVTATLIGITLWSSTRSSKISMGLTILTVMLYGLLYWILQWEDYALAAGVGLLVLAVGLVMYATRRKTAPES